MSGALAIASPTIIRSDESAGSLELCSNLTAATAAMHGGQKVDEIESIRHCTIRDGLHEDKISLKSALLLAIRLT